MGVDVDAVLFVGVKERDLPKKALKKLASLEVYDEYKNDENLFEDESLSSWLEEYVKQPVPGYPLNFLLCGTVNTQASLLYSLALR